MDSSPDRDFYGRACLAHEGPLLRYAASLLGDIERARDVVQDTFLRFLRQPRASVDGHVAEWLYTVCRNRALDVHRKESRMRTTDDSVLADRPDSAPSPAAAVERDESVGQLLRLLAELPPRQAECLRLRFGGGLSYKEISRVTSHSVSYVGVLIHEGLKTLRERARRAAPQAEGRPS